jgi:Pvc16 N-terminal domain
MVDEVDQRLKDWAIKLLPGVEVSFAPPSDAKADFRGVGVYLLDVLQSPPPSTLKRPPLQVMLRYLITTWSEKPEDAHKMMGQLAMGALDEAGFLVETEAVPSELWRAFGIVPRPCIIVRMPLRQERKDPRAKAVLSPLQVTVSPVTSFFGLLIGPGDIPLADAAVEVPSLRLLTRSDRKGQFGFRSVPSQAPLDLRIRAKSKEFRLTIDEPHPAPEDPLKIPLDVLEG